MKVIGINIKKEIFSEIQAELLMTVNDISYLKPVNKVKKELKNVEENWFEDSQINSDYDYLILDTNDKFLKYLAGICCVITPLHPNDFKCKIQSIKSSIKFNEIKEIIFDSCDTIELNLGNYRVYTDEFIIETKDNEYKISADLKTAVLIPPVRFNFRENKKLLNLLFEYNFSFFEISDKDLKKEISPTKEKILLVKKSHSLLPFINLQAKLHTIFEEQNFDFEIVNKEDLNLELAIGE